MQWLKQKHKKKEMSILTFVSVIPHISLNLSIDIITGTKDSIKSGFGENVWIVDHSVHVLPAEGAAEAVVMGLAT